MKNYEDRVRFVVRFVEMDLRALRPGAWRDLREDFINFADIPSPRRKECTPDVLDTLQLQALGVLLKISSQNRVPSQESTGWSWEAPIKVIWTFKDGDFHPALPVADQLVGDPRQLFRWALFITLSKVDVSRGRQCAEQCVQKGGIPRSRLFWAENGNQWYCSPRCTNRANLRRYRHKDQEGHEKIRKED